MDASLGRDFDRMMEWADPSRDAMGVRPGTPERREAALSEREPRPENVTPHATPVRREYGSVAPSRSENADLTTAIDKLRWSARGDEWSTTVSPAECRALLAALGNATYRESA